MAVNVDGATTDHEHDHGGFSEHQIRARLFSFFLRSLIIPQLFCRMEPGND
jgi:hypothetical protein